MAIKVTRASIEPDCWIVLPRRLSNSSGTSSQALHTLRGSSTVFMTRCKVDFERYLDTDVEKCNKYPLAFTQSGNRPIDSRLDAREPPRCSRHIRRIAASGTASGELSVSPRRPSVMCLSVRPNCGIHRNGRRQTMGADITVYCLQNVTDYFQFERLCHDLMALEGYSSIEPLGGFRDRGRDAVHVSRSGRTTMFAYSVREDWRAKLAEDASKINNHGHTCNRLVFVTTATFTAGERDEAIAFVADEYRWQLELYGAERLRILLDVTHPGVKEHHPQIFPPALFARPSRADISTAKDDHIFISFAPEDSVLADWLARKLVVEGYRVWYERSNLYGGEAYPESIDEAIKHYSFCVIALYSQASLTNPEVMSQRALALHINRERGSDFLIPIDVDGVKPSQLDRAAASLVFISFAGNWAAGIKRLLKKLDSSGCPKPLCYGKTMMAQALPERDVISDHPEILLSNCLRVDALPQTIQRFELLQSIPPKDLDQLCFLWAFRRINRLSFLSFHQPPLSIIDRCGLRLVGREFWRSAESVYSIPSKNLVSELIRKSLIVKCHQKGLSFCPDTGLHYFPLGLPEKNHLKFKRLDGSKGYVNATGQRAFWRPSGSQDYRYHLAPVFSVARDLFGEFTVLLRIRILLTDTSGLPLALHAAKSRRKHLCRGWWNKEWADRLLAICQFLAEGDKIVIGDREDELVTVDATPMSFEAPLGINEAVLEGLSYARSAEFEQEDDVSDRDEGYG